MHKESRRAISEYAVQHSQLAHFDEGTMLRLILCGEERSAEIAVTYSAGRTFIDSPSHIVIETLWARDETGCWWNVPLMLLSEAQLARLDGAVEIEHLCRADILSNILEEDPRFVDWLESAGVDDYIEEHNR